MGPESVPGCHISDSQEVSTPLISFLPLQVDHKWALQKSEAKAINALRRKVGKVGKHKAAPLATKKNA